MSARVRDMNQEDGEFIQVPFRRGNAEMSECSTNLRTSSVQYRVRQVVVHLGSVDKNLGSSPGLLGQ